MAINALSYIGVNSDKIEDWSDYSQKCLGMQRVDRAKGTLSFRMDDHKQRLAITGDTGDSLAFMGWEVEKKEDYRFYYSSGINYFITFYVGTESFLNKTYGVVGLEENSNQEMLILVLEHTATRNKLFYFNKKTKTETELLKEFLSN